MDNSAFLTGYEFLIVTPYLLLVLFCLRLVKQRHSDESLNRYFYPGFFFKLIFAVLFAVLYLFFLGGGDINAYWDGASSLADLFYTNPEGYVQELWQTHREYGINYHFNSDTGYPPGWIWREEEAWTAAKIISIFSILTFKSFWATTLLISWATFAVSWALAVQLVRCENMHKVACVIAFLFIPSVAFWCSGISKDSLTYFLTLLFIYQAFLWIKWGSGKRLLRGLGLIFILVLLYNLRHFLAFAIFVPFVLAVLSRYASRFSGRPLLLWLYRFFLYTIFIGSVYVVISSDQTQALINEANITKQDFSNNPIYTGAKYEMPTNVSSPIQLLGLFPRSFLTAMFRPTFLDPVGPSFVINQLESLLFIFLTLRFLFSPWVLRSISSIIRNEFLLFSIIFIFFVGFMSGYTSILFGVLVRIRAIALPFLVLVLFQKFKPQDKTP